MSQTGYSPFQAECHLWSRMEWSGASPFKNTHYLCTIFIQKTPNEYRFMREFCKIVRSVMRSSNGGWHCTFFFLNCPRHMAQVSTHTGFSKQEAQSTLSACITCKLWLLQEGRLQNTWDQMTLDYFCSKFFRTTLLVTSYLLLLELPNAHGSSLHSP